MVQATSKELAYAASVEGLLHDVGKPVTRLLWRMSEGIEHVEGELLERLRLLLGDK